MYSQKSYRWSVYYNACPLTLHVLLLCIKFHCIVNAKNVVESALKRRGCQQSGREIWIPKNIYHDDSKKKRQAVKKRCNDKKRFVKQYKKEKDVENEASKNIYLKVNFQENWKANWIFQK